ncbi:MAG: hypothetical protein Q3989_03240, partial [Eubacteriales bacterium]|nr:hypothetical protein [Eubacteriales bacterium]
TRRHRPAQKSGKQNYSRVRNLKKRCRYQPAAVFHFKRVLQKHPADYIILSGRGEGNEQR